MNPFTVISVSEYSLSHVSHALDTRGPRAAGAAGGGEKRGTRVNSAPVKARGSFEQ